VEGTVHDLANRERRRFVCLGEVPGITDYSDAGCNGGSYGYIVNNVDNGFSDLMRLFIAADLAGKQVWVTVEPKNPNNSADACRIRRVRMWRCHTLPSRGFTRMRQLQELLGRHRRLALFLALLSVMAAGCEMRDEEM